MEAEEDKEYGEEAEEECEEMWPLMPLPRQEHQGDQRGRRKPGRSHLPRHPGPGYPKGLLPMKTRSGHIESDETQASCRGRNGLSQAGGRP